MTSPRNKRQIFQQVLKNMEKHNKFQFFPQRFAQLFYPDSLPSSILFTLHHTPIKNVLTLPLSYKSRNSSIRIYSQLLKPMKEAVQERPTSRFQRKKNKSRSRILIDQRFCLKSLKGRHLNYNFYKGVDLQRSKWVSIYVKKTQSNFSLSRQVKEHLRNIICPKVIWSGDAPIDGLDFSIEVHQKLGPSLQTLFDTLAFLPKDRDLLHLLLEMVKLVERIYSLNLVSGQLDPNLIIFDASPKKNQLYLLNSFTLKRKNTESKPIHSKYCSRGMHMGRNVCVKDDLESVCYILIDLYTGGKFLEGKVLEQFQEEKLSLKIENFALGLPQVFIDFYNYVVNLNYSEDINFFYWKTHLTRILSYDVVNQPYRFLLTPRGEVRRFTDFTQKNEEPEEQEDPMDIDNDEQETKQENIKKLRREMPVHLEFKSNRK